MGAACQPPPSLVTRESKGEGTDGARAEGAEEGRAEAGEVRARGLGRKNWGWGAHTGVGGRHDLLLFALFGLPRQTCTQPQARSTPDVHSTAGKKHS